MKIGVIGTGGLVEKYFDLIRNHAQYDLVAYCHNLEPNATFQSPLLDSEVHLLCSKEELLETVEAVLILNNNYSYTLVKEAVQKGKHVFMEKPLMYSLEQIQQLIKLAGESQVVVHILAPERYNPALMSALPLIKKPLFLEFKRFAKRNEKSDEKSPFSVVFELMINDLDILLYWLNSTPKRIIATGRKTNNSSIDYANVVLEFMNGTIAVFTADRLAVEERSTCLLVQKNGQIHLDLKAQKLKRINIESQTEEESLTVLEQNPMQEELEVFLKEINHSAESNYNLENSLRPIMWAHQIVEKIYHFL